MLLKVKNTVNGSGRIVCMRGQYRSISFPADNEGQMVVILSHLSGSVSTMLMLRITQLLGQILSVLDSRSFEDLAKKI